MVTGDTHTHTAVSYFSPFKNRLFLSLILGYEDGVSRDVSQVT